jgi:hypothetical protein
VKNPVVGTVVPQEVAILERKDNAKSSNEQLSVEAFLYILAKHGSL